MRVRLGCFGWLCLGWVILPCYVLFYAAKGLVCLFLAAMKALDKHNRRRAVRKAYERDRAARAAVRTRQLQELNRGRMPQYYPQGRVPIQWQDEHGNWRVS
jgi:hypothetical protein